MWIFEGNTNHVSCFAPDSSDVEGAYILLIILSDESTRLATTRTPNRFLVHWQNQSRQCAGVKIKKVLISATHPRNEKIKRVLLKQVNNMDTAESISQKLAAIYSAIKNGSQIINETRAT